MHVCTLQLALIRYAGKLKVLYRYQCPMKGWLLALRFCKELISRGYYIENLKVRFNNASQKASYECLLKGST